MSDVLPTLLELENELCSVTDWEGLAVQLGLQWYEVERIRKDEQVKYRRTPTLWVYENVFI